MLNSGSAAFGVPGPWRYAFSFNTDVGGLETYLDGIDI